MSSTRQRLTKQQLADLAAQRILVLDGATGTMIQHLKFSEEQFRGTQFKDHPAPLQGNNDLLCLTQPEAIRHIHDQYLEAGADIIETNTFNATSVSQADYDCQQHVYDINLKAAELARAAADAWTEKTPDQPRFVAGSIGATNKMTSLSPDVNQPEFRAIDFDDLAASYREQIAALLDGQVDILLIETVIDTLNCKAALYAARQEMRARDIEVPLWVSGTITDASGRILSGQTPEAFWYSIEHAQPDIVGFNCALGAKEMRPHLQELASVASTLVSVHPNAGLPNEMGEYDETAEHMGRWIEQFARDGLVNLVGGCCGTTPDFITAFCDGVKDVQPRAIPEKKRTLTLSGLEPLVLTKDINFVNIGERTNVAGSKKFARLIREGAYEEAIQVAADQVENGAQIIDINLDDGMLDSEQEMVHLLRLIAAEPDIARVPIMVDSSKFSVLLAGLKNIQGKAVVNSISLKEGEEEFLRHAQTIMDFGAAVVVMAFDENGQAGDTQHKFDICKRSYDLLTSIGFPPEDIIFDPNILTVATGLMNTTTTV